MKIPLTKDYNFGSSRILTCRIPDHKNWINVILKDEKPKYISVILDTKAKTFRHKEYDLYKANRKPMPDDLSEQLPMLYNVLDLLNIKIFKKDGYEASISSFL